MVAGNGLANQAFSAGVSPMEQPCTGQRWMSLSEPELGLGEVMDVSADAVSVHFPAVDEQRATDVRAFFDALRLQVGQVLQLAAFELDARDRAGFDGPGFAGQRFEREFSGFQVLKFSRQL